MSLSTCKMDQAFISTSSSHLCKSECLILYEPFAYKTCILITISTLRTTITSLILVLETSEISYTDKHHFISALE